MPSVRQHFSTITYHLPCDEEGRSRIESFSGSTDVSVALLLLWITTLLRLRERKSKGRYRELASASPRSICLPRASSFYWTCQPSISLQTHDDFFETVADAPKEDAQWKFATHFMSVSIPNDMTSSSAPASPINQASSPPPSNTPISRGSTSPNFRYTFVAFIIDIGRETEFNDYNKSWCFISDGIYYVKQSYI